MAAHFAEMTAFDATPSNVLDTFSQSTMRFDEIMTQQFLLNVDAHADVGLCRSPYMLLQEHLALRRKHMLVSSIHQASDFARIHEFHRNWNRCLLSSTVC